MNSKKAEKQLPPHVLLFPFPAHSHLHQMLKIAELLCHAGLHVTVAITDQTHRQLINDAGIRSRFDRYPGFRLQNLRDGIPMESPKSLDKIVEFTFIFEQLGIPRFKDLLTSSDWKKESPVARRSSITCIIVDLMMANYGVDVGEEVGVPVMCYCHSFPSDFWVFYCVPKLIEAGELPFQGDDMDVPIKNVPGLEGLLRRRDLSSFLRVDDLSDEILQRVVKAATQAHRARALILQTFEEIEGATIAQLRSQGPKVYPIAPLKEHLQTRLASVRIPPESLKEQDASCIAWLDKQPLKSVMYISFGSIEVKPREELMELWHGLKNSGTRFLWALPNIVDKELKKQIPPEILEDSRGKGYIVSWAPQEEVLAHKAVGGFLTQSGWSSVLESIAAGVPMLCWPCFADHQTASRFVAEVWKIGLDMKDTCDRVIMEKLIRELMDTRKEEFARSANQMAKLAEKANSKGGSSYVNLDRLVEDIRSLGATG